jgi:thiamine-monophosphate kinase
MPKKLAQPTSENRLIQLLKRRHPAKSAWIKMGIGDDAAVIHPKSAKELWLITTDMLVETIDFHRDWTTPEQLGRKSISVNLSDLAAMGARPRFFTVSLAIPPAITEQWILGFHDGLTEKGEAFGAHLVGGDLSRSKACIVISVTAIGESLNRKVLYRSGAKAGDCLYVTGMLGRSAAGLKRLKDGHVPRRLRSQEEALQAHLDPEPRCDAGLWLAQSGLVHCMMDLSDGLSVDLPRLCDASGVGAEIYAPDLPVFPGSALWDCDPVDLALHGGEDFELLFAVPGSKSRLLENTYPATLSRITRIGVMTADAGNVWIVGQNRRKGRRRLPQRGYDHFKAGRH